MARQLTTIVIGVIGVSAVMIVAGLLVWASGPAVSTPQPQVTSAHEPDTAPAEHLLTLDTPLYSSHISGGYKIRSQQDKPAGVIQSSLVASETQEQGSQLAITVADLPDDGLRAVSDVVLRRNAPEKYTETSVDGVPTGSLVFVSSSPYELTIFFPHDQYYAAASLSYTKPLQERYTNQLQELIRNWSWK